MKPIVIELERHLALMFALGVVANSDDMGFIDDTVIIDDADDIIGLRFYDRHVISPYYEIQPKIQIQDKYCNENWRGNGKRRRRK